MTLPVPSEMTDENLMRRPRELLTAAEVDLLRRGLAEWSGSARCSEEFAVAFGFASIGDLKEKCRAFRRELGDDAPLAPHDWARILLSTETVFVSDLAGSGVEWTTTAGLADEYTIVTLRSIQRKLVRVVQPYFGKRPS